MCQHIIFTVDYASLLVNRPDSHGEHRRRWVSWPEIRRFEPFHGTQKALQACKWDHLPGVYSGHAAEACFLSHARRFPSLAREESRRRKGTSRRLLQEGLRQAQHHLARVCGRGAMLRLDRWHPKANRRIELQHPLHAAKTQKHLERRQ